MVNIKTVYDENDYDHESIDDNKEQLGQHGRKEQNDDHRIKHIPSNHYDYHNYYKSSMNEASLFLWYFPICVPVV
jgi:hypothetical protein